MCGGFTCSKNALTALNVLYILVSFILIGVAAYGRVASIVTNIAIIGGIIACGVFLFLLSLLGLIGAIKHHQVLLFFYMVILFLLFVVQFGIACACLAFNKEQQHELAEEGWDRATKDLKTQTEKFFVCCGFMNITGPDEADRCFHAGLSCCQSVQDCNCQGCWKKLGSAINSALKISGGIGLFFSFTELISIWIAFRFRKQRDPKENPHNYF